MHLLLGNADNAFIGWRSCAKGKGRYVGKIESLPIDER